MFVGATLPEEIRPLETDTILEYSSSLCIRAFARRLPDDEFNLWSALETDGFEPTRTFIEHGEPQVHKYRSNPPGFIISPGYNRVQNLIREIDLPTGPFDVYFSKMWSADEFLGLPTIQPQKYEGYSVETFGVRVISLPFSYAYEDNALPNPSHLPRYWLTSSLRLIQVRRLKVFKCPLKHLVSRVPLSDGPEPILYLEERWDPRRWGITELGGVGIKDSNEVGTFLRTARRILAGDPKRGRPQGTRQYPIGREFYELARAKFSELQDKFGRPPLRKEVALALGLSISSLKSYWCTTGRLWPPRKPYVTNVYGVQTPQVE
jgi:hypothetical protein